MEVQAKAALMVKVDSLKARPANPSWGSHQVKGRRKKTLKKQKPSRTRTN